MSSSPPHQIRHGICILGCMDQCSPPPSRSDDSDRQLYEGPNLLSKDRNVPQKRAALGALANMIINDREIMLILYRTRTPCLVRNLCSNCIFSVFKIYVLTVSLANKAINAQEGYQIPNKIDI